MSRNVGKVKHFFHLLLEHTTSKQQGWGLIYSVNNSQINAITEIIHNLLQGNISLSPKNKDTLRKNKKIIELLGNPKKSNSQKSKLFKIHYKLLLKLLLSLRTEIFKQLE